MGARWQLWSCWGAVGIGRHEDAYPIRGYIFSGYPQAPFRNWWPKVIFAASMQQLLLPLWLLLAPTLLATAAAWRLDALARRRARAGRCPKCG
jgi:hypothetical protein